MGVAVTHLERQVFVHRLPDGEGLRRRWVDADNRDRSGFGDDFYGPLERLRRRVTGNPGVSVRVLLWRDLLELCFKLLFLLRVRGSGAVAGVLCVYGVDHLVHPDATGQPHDGFNRVFLTEVDDFSALRFGGV